RRRAGRQWFAVEKGLQVLGKISGAGVAPFRLFSQAAQANRLQIGGDVRPDLGRWLRLLVADLVERLQQALALEGRLAGEGFVEDRAQSIDVGGRADLLDVACRLFG